MSPAAGWYAVAIAGDIEPGTSAGTRLHDRELVVWRDLSGESHVWEDRCPHRGMRLSLGFVRGNHIACLYHGWAYDTAGQCRAIPAHPELTPPETIKVATYRSAEASGLIHVWSGLGDEAAPPPPADEPLKTVRSLSIDRPADDVARALARVGGFERIDGGSFAGSLVGTRVRLWLQPFTSVRAMLHVAIEGDGDALAVSAAAAALRNAIEAATAAPAALHEVA